MAEGLLKFKQLAKSPHSHHGHEQNPGFVNRPRVLSEPSPIDIMSMNLGMTEAYPPAALLARPVDVEESAARWH